ncbi:AAA family ATPase [Trichococcus shcherbakoviae]|uniref:AAA family ATPase n=1 Tax=Trichococcus shcherbakoviae TaxID=2094020 RepID=UPI002AA6737D|nr:AAA family ATPase [Trichococcus shcherbakoviae]
MPAKLQELELIYRRERVRFDSGTAILECEEPIKPESANHFGGADRRFADSMGGLNALLAGQVGGVTVKVDCQPDELVAALTYRFYGTWKTHEKYGKQFIAKTFVRCQPHSKAGVIRYLQTTCAGFGVGHVTAVKLWDKFQGDAVRILREQPEVAVAAVAMSHFTADKAEKAAAILQLEVATENTTQEILDIIDGKGFRKSIVKAAIGEWGTKAGRLIKTNPYLLRRFPGAGFALCDRLYIDLGHNPAKLKRQAACIEHLISRDREGHTWFMPQFLERGLGKLIGGAKVTPIEAAMLAKRAGRISIRQSNDGRIWIADRRMAEAEQLVADRLRDAQEEPVLWPDISDLDVSDHQREQLQIALQSPVCLFTGSPGTGKTRTIARLIAAVAEKYGEENVAAFTPTGKAGVRLSQALAGYQCPVSAGTIYRLLGVASVSADEGWSFAHNEKYPLEQKFFFLDEGSMPAIPISASLVRALPRGAHLCIIGDTNQLPPIEHGAPLRDLIAAGFPCGELREIWRNSGTIVEACAAIRDSKRIPFDSIGQFDPDGQPARNLLLTPTRDNAASLEAIVAMLRKLRMLGIDPVWDAQILCMVNKKSELSREAINKRVQAELNPNGERAAHSPLRVGDKIIRTKKNTLMPIAPCSDYEANAEAIDDKVLVCNGEVGRVIGTTGHVVVAKFDAPNRIIKIPYGTPEENNNAEDDSSEETTATGCDFDLGYAGTVHKFQGSESKVILWGLDESPGARMLGTRELFYTGISRGKYFDVLFGKRQTAESMCFRRAITKRKTFLKELLTREMK